MTRTLTLLALATTALLSNSCSFCCTSDSKAPSLRSLPKFKNLPSAPTPEVITNSPSAPTPEVSDEK